MILFYQKSSVHNISSSKLICVILYSVLILSICKQHKYIFPIYVDFHFTALDCTVFMRVSRGWSSWGSFACISEYNWGSSMFLRGHSVSFPAIIIGLTKSYSYHCALTLLRYQVTYNVSCNQIMSVYGYSESTDRIILWNGLM